MFRFVQGYALHAVLAAAQLLACTEEVRLGHDLGASGAGGMSPAGGATATPEAGTSGVEFPLGGAGGSPGEVPAPVLPDAGPCVQLPCGGSVRACGDCLDNDADGRLDANDPECLGPCDDNERELQSGIPVNITGSCRTDCYFDLNAGSGDDRCDWSLRCDPLSVSPAYDPTGRAACEYDPTLSACDGSALVGCERGCLPLTPNGCDCFGCCELPAGSGSFTWLGSGADERPCTPSPACQNPCDECELCVGKPTLPASCSAAAPLCPSGVPACDPLNRSDCEFPGYCITGCCVLLPR